MLPQIRFDRPAIQVCTARDFFDRAVPGVAIPLQNRYAAAVVSNSTLQTEPLPPALREARALSPAERLARMERLQREAFALLQASPEGYRRFWERNLRQRRIHVPR